MNTNQTDFFPVAARLALELECLLLSCKDTAAVSKWWDSAHEALQQFRDASQAEPVGDALEFRVRDAIKGMANCIADPMWPSHAEVSKANLKRWHKLLHDLLAAQSGQRAGAVKAFLMADNPDDLRCAQWVIANGSAKRGEEQWPL